MMKEVDIDNNGTLDFEEFVSVMTDGEGFEEEEEEEEDLVALQRRKSSFSLMSSPSVAEKEAEVEEQAKALILCNHIRKAWNGEARNK
jgi:hypothetical protein